MSEHWHTLMPEADFPADGKHTARINGWWVMVAKTETGYFAINDRCTHQASQLSGGRIRRGAVMCPLHGARFELASGRCLGGAYKDLRTFPLRLHHGMIEVAVPLHGPTMEDLPVAF